MNRYDLKTIYVGDDSGGYESISMGKSSVGAYVKIKDVKSKKNKIIKKMRKIVDEYTKEINELARSEDKFDDRARSSLVTKANSMIDAISIVKEML
jgi:hypothetical protein